MMRGSTRSSCSWQRRCAARTSRTPRRLAEANLAAGHRRLHSKSTSTSHSSHLQVIVMASSDRICFMRE
eukprot:6204247-Pleurochrysis_carterae.AAC.1